MEAGMVGPGRSGWGSWAGDGQGVAAAGRSMAVSITRVSFSVKRNIGRTGSRRVSPASHYAMGETVAAPAGQRLLVHGVLSGTLLTRRPQPIAQPSLSCRTRPSIGRRHAVSRASRFVPGETLRRRVRVCIGAWGLAACLRSIAVGSPRQCRVAVPEMPPSFSCMGFWQATRQPEASKKSGTTDAHRCTPMGQ
jgi:hypothetical protein